MSQADKLTGTMRLSPPFQLRLPVDALARCLSNESAEEEM
jgi:hypothetical protein